MTKLIATITLILATQLCGHNYTDAHLENNLSPVTVILSRFKRSVKDKMLDAYIEGQAKGRKEAQNRNMYYHNLKIQKGFQQGVYDSYGY